MTALLATEDLNDLTRKFDAEPSLSEALPGACYTDPKYFEIEKRQIFTKTWQFVCHVEKV